MMIVEEGPEGYQSFTDLKVWKMARAFKIAVYEVLEVIPFADTDLRSQLKRSARSIPTNISEGHGRYTFRDQLNFCVIARGSLSESYNHLIDAYDCQYVTRERLVVFKNQIDELGKTLNGYMNFLRGKIPASQSRTTNPRNSGTTA